ncbi:hypothetical protein EDE12_106173 [Methylosinus sp. sav-2]|uniref:hypothetical protein n=1 Tax=Methylosinus sp. sav-2 TaxID=2485168 RepID=UPI00047A10EB|nr:hypothetical protein [Methylosinus sp. sav-2]TDX64027.1 hypothetical protein EDE12_106173 [Methylosinus sp. sav-2]
MRDISPDSDFILIRCAVASIPATLDLDDEPQLLRHLIDDDTLSLREAIRLAPRIGHLARHARTFGLADALALGQSEQALAPRPSAIVEQRSAA